MSGSWTVNPCRLVGSDQACGAPIRTPVKTISSGPLETSAHGPAGPRCGRVCRGMARPEAASTSNTSAPEFGTSSGQYSRSPSGDQSGVPLVGNGSRRTRSAPVATSTMAREPRIFAKRPRGFSPFTKAIDSPSGDHAGWS